LELTAGAIQVTQASFVDEYGAWVKSELDNFATKPYIMYTCWFFDRYTALLQ
jgi:hypothetical protein